MKDCLKDMWMKNKRPNKYWQNINHCIAEAEKAMKELGVDELPGAGVLSAGGYCNLVSAVQRYHGGFYKFRESLGQKKLMAESGAWRDLDYTLNEARNVMKSLGAEKLPGSPALCDKGYSSLVSAITKYHGGFHKFRKLLGQGQIIREKGLWQNLDYAVGEARKAMAALSVDKLPNSTVLDDRGYSGLVTAIHEYHGGFHKFRKLLGQEQIMTEKGTWADLGYTLSEARKAMKKLGVDKIPNSTMLNSKGYSSLATAINEYHGGFYKFRKMLGQKQLIAERGLWPNLDYALGEAKKAMKSLGVNELPSYDILRKEGYSSLADAINNHHDGFNAFRAVLNQRLGIKSEKQKLEGLLEGYVEDGK